MTQHNTEDENLNLDLDTKNVNMELCFVASAFKPKSILTVELTRPNDIVSLVLNADENALITSTDCDSQTYENVRAEFEKYDILPRLNFYTGEPEEILPWIEGKFDLIVLFAPVDEELLEALLADGGKVVIEKSIFGKCDTCCFQQTSLENVKNYYIFE